MYFKIITFQKVTGPTPNQFLCYQHTPELHQGTAKAGGVVGGLIFFIYKIFTKVLPPLYRSGPKPFGMFMSL